MSGLKIGILLLLPVFCCAQQKKLTGNMIYLLGNDTTMAGTYMLQENDFEVTVLSRPNVTVTKMKGSFFSNGELKEAEGYAYKPLSNGDTQMLTRYKLFVQNDSTFITSNNITQKFAAKGMLANAMGTPFRYMLPFWSVYGPQHLGDSVVSNHLTFGTGRKLILKRIAVDKIFGGSNVMGNFTFHLDRSGKITYIDGIGSSWNTIAKVVPALDMKALTERFILNEKVGEGVTIINQFDSIKAVINDANIKIYYSRPSVRGRNIFGAVVPWDRFWRTGANAATKFVTDKPLRFDDKILPAGEYSLWTVPSPNQWTLMFNSKANIWGTEYDPNYNVIKIPMQATSQFDRTELMTITVEADASDKKKGMINIIWEKQKASVTFSLNK